MRKLFETLLGHLFTVRSGNTGANITVTDWRIFSRADVTVKEKLSLYLTLTCFLIRQSRIALWALGLRPEEGHGTVYVGTLIQVIQVSKSTDL